MVARPSAASVANVASVRGTCGGAASPNASSVERLRIRPGISTPAVSMETTGKCVANVDVSIVDEDAAARSASGRSAT